MPNNPTPNNLEKVFDFLSEEAEQEEAISNPATSLFANVNAEVVREREIEYKDPEKHYVRRYSWLSVAKTIHTQTMAERGRGLRYLTLPSFYRLDVSMLLEEKLLDARLNDKGEVRSVYVAAFETDPVKYGRMIGHSPEFLLFGNGSIEDALIDSKNEYYDELHELFPFDIINLDLTSSLTPKHEGPYSKTMRAIEEVFKLQASCRTRWALFLTFRNNPSDWEKDTLKQLFDNLQSNLDNFPKVQKAFIDLYNENTVDNLKNKDTKQCISQAVVKWLVDRAHYYSIQNEAIKCYKYQRYPTGLPPYLITKQVLIFSQGEVLKAKIPTKGVVPQPWMEDNLVSCIANHKPLDVEGKLIDIAHNKPAIWDEIESNIGHLCDLVK